MSLFNEIGENFFSPLTGKNKEVYFDCLKIIYNSYLRERGGIERENIVQKLCYYFDELSSDVFSEEITDEDSVKLSDTQAKANYVIRRLKNCKWINLETDYNNIIRITMPSHATDIMRDLLNAESEKDLDYLGCIVAVYSLLNDESLLEYYPYSQVIQKVHDDTAAVFRGLQQLNTKIKKYVERLTEGKTAGEILDNYMKYSREIGSKEYHCLMTNRNIFRFRSSILTKLDNIRSNSDLMEAIAAEYSKVQNVPIDTARDDVVGIIGDLIERYYSFDKETEKITTIHRRYLSQTKERAEFLLSNTNKLEDKIKTILRYIAEDSNRKSAETLNEYMPDDMLTMFNIYQQGFISEESIMIAPRLKKITEAEILSVPKELSAEEIQVAVQNFKNFFASAFNQDNINDYVLDTVLKDKDAVMASDIPIETRRDMMRLIFVFIYGHDRKAGYTITATTEKANIDGYIFYDFVIKRGKAESV